MSAYKIFIVGTSNDYTNYINTNEYETTREDVMETWTDANRVDRASVVRTRVSGSVKMRLNKVQYDAFLSHWSSAKNADGTFNLKVHVNTDDTSTETVNIKAFATLAVRVVYGTKMYGYQPAGMEISIDFREA